MRYRLLGNSGLRVSEAALGAMTFGDEWGWGSAKDEAKKCTKPFGRPAVAEFLSDGPTVPVPSCETVGAMPSSAA